MWSPGEHRRQWPSCFQQYFWSRDEVMVALFWITKS
jgi:heme A synthase